MLLGEIRCWSLLVFNGQGPFYLLLQCSYRTGLSGTYVLRYQQPRFSETPLKTDADVNNWLKFYDMSSPLVCVGVFESHDPVSTVFHFNLPRQ